MRSILITLGLCFSMAASAQEIDSHGFQMIPSDGELHDTTSVWRAETHEQHSVGINGLFEYARRPLTLYRSREGVIREGDLISDMTALNLGVFYAPHERISLTASAPMFLSVDSTMSDGGFGLGDIRLASAVTVLGRPYDDFHLSVVPFADIPGPYDPDSQLGLSGLSGGGLVAASVTGERWDLSGNLGAQFTPEVDFYNLRGKEKLLTGVSASYAIVDDVALRGEWVFKPTLRRQTEAWTESPMEAIVSLRGHSGNNFGWTVGGATALDRSVSAATWRVLAGVDLAFGARSEEEVVCSGCDLTNLTVLVVDEEDQITDTPMFITDGEVGAELHSTDTIGLPSERHYLLKITVPKDSLVSVQGETLLLLEPIYFDFDESTIRFPESTQVLADLVTVLDENPDLRLVEVAGHTDERGSDEYNQALSQRRMTAVVDYLVSHGIDRERLMPVGYGEGELSLDDCSAAPPDGLTSEECHQLNRRVEFTILERD